MFYNKFFSVVRRHGSVDLAFQVFRGVITESVLIGNCLAPLFLSARKVRLSDSFCVAVHPSQCRCEPKHSDRLLLFKLTISSLKRLSFCFKRFSKTSRARSHSLIGSSDARDFPYVTLSSMAIFSATLASFAERKSAHKLAGASFVARYSIDVHKHSSYIECHSPKCSWIFRGV